MTGAAGQTPSINAAPREKFHREPGRTGVEVFQGWRAAGRVDGLAEHDPKKISPPVLPGSL
jgi:hypothetical protein